ncbi:MAG: hypothetical protein RLY31_445 [Bacteroidota bacterium]
MDRQDPLRAYRSSFLFPRQAGRKVLYFCGNSLGLQPRGVGAALREELRLWAEEGVEGHFRGERPWMYYHRFLQPQSARLMGAQDQEVVVMNTLSVNLHLLMVSFYTPTRERFKILMEGHAFPSDQYVVESQVRMHGCDPAAAVVELFPRQGEDCLREEDILAAIREQGSSLALVLFGGVNYYTGQWFDMQAITAAAHAVGAVAGFDLAHAVGNVPLSLHEWNVDFACWCSYKYLNAGPGGPGGIFVHARHGDRPELQRLAGWWGHDEDSRFRMEKGFVPMRGAAGWQLSNAQVLGMAAHRVGLDLFDAAGMDALRRKSLLLTGHLRFLLERLQAERPLFRILTPSEPHRHGSQLSLLTLRKGRAIFDYLSANGVVADWREPDVIRLATVPMYNRFEDGWRLYDLLRKMPA